MAFHPATPDTVPKYECRLEWSTRRIYLSTGTNGSYQREPFVTGARFLNRHG
jgi:hypothetical protein